MVDLIRQKSEYQVTKTLCLLELLAMQRLGNMVSASRPTAISMPSVLLNELLTGNLQTKFMVESWTL